MIQYIFIAIIVIIALYFAYVFFTKKTTSTTPIPTPATNDTLLGPNNPKSFYTRANIFVVHSKIDGRWYVVVADLVKGSDGTYKYGTNVPNTYYIMYTAANGAAFNDQPSATTFAKSNYNSIVNIKIYDTDGSHSVLTDYDTQTPLSF